MSPQPQQKIKRIWKNLKAGLYSGYPLCCTVFYSLALDSGIINKHRYVKWANKYPEFNFFASAPYIRCPHCSFMYIQEICRIDENRGDCLKVSFFDAVKMYFKWRSLSCSEQIEHNIKIIQ